MRRNATTVCWTRKFDACARPQKLIRYPSSPSIVLMMIQNFDVVDLWRHENNHASREEILLERSATRLTHLIVESFKRPEKMHLLPDTDCLSDRTVCHVTQKNTQNYCAAFILCPPPIRMRMGCESKNKPSKSDVIKNRFCERQNKGGCVAKAKNSSLGFHVSDERRYRLIVMKECSVSKLEVGDACLSHNYDCWSNLFLDL